LDNPSLTTRNWFGKDPIRLVIDKDLTLPKDLCLFDGKVRTIIFTQKASAENHPSVEYIRLDFTQNILPQIMEVLYNLKVQSLLVEGGSILLQSFIDEGLWDEAYIETSPIYLNEGIRAPKIDEKHKHSTYNYFGRDVLHFKNEAF
jgi:diaminohydroxyphosphoribosylaminopyrimidine deaminase/5-amino-6-(5-phosphoribosylamino)uracil reductase